MAVELTVEELAARAGVTVRNIRAYQTRGLLPSPRLRGRTGVYSEAHVARLGLIKEMQSAGFGLKAIRKLLEAAPEGAEEEVLRFERALLAPWSSEEPEIVSAAELAERFDSPSAEVAERAQRLGLIDPLPDGRVRVCVPTLLGVADDMRAMGISLDELLDVIEVVFSSSEVVTKTFVDLFLREIWRPFDEQGRPAERWPEVRSSIEKLRPIATRVVNAVFASSMTSAVEAAFQEELDREGAEQKTA